MAIHTQHNITRAVCVFSVHQGCGNQNNYKAHENGFCVYYKWINASPPRRLWNDCDERGWWCSQKPCKNAYMCLAFPNCHDPASYDMRAIHKEVMFITNNKAPMELSCVYLKWTVPISQVAKWGRWIGDAVFTNNRLKWKSREVCMKWIFPIL